MWYTCFLEAVAEKSKALFAFFWRDVWQATSAGDHTRSRYSTNKVFFSLVEFMAPYAAAVKKLALLFFYSGLLKRPWANIMDSPFCPLWKKREIHLLRDAENTNIPSCFPSLSHL
jgi:hypothetical protein